MHEFEQIEDAAIAKLAGISGLKTIDAYCGQLDAESLDELTLQFPCVYVTAGSMACEPNNRYDKLSIEFSLIVGDRNVRGAKAAARGDVSSPGVYEILYQCKATLHRKALLSGWTYPTLKKVRPLVYAPKLNLCLYEGVYRIQAEKLPNI